MKKCWCGNSDLSEYSKEYFWCKKCNTLVTKSNEPVKTDNLDDDNDFYGQQYWKELMLTRAKCEDMDSLIDLYLSERAAYWLKTVYRFLLPGHCKVLEIGCGLGQLSYLLKCSGYEETAYELSPSICKYVQNELHINVINAPFKKNGERYDAIIAMDLVEHLEDPDRFFSDISESISNDGIVLIQTPCFNEKLTYDEIAEKNPEFLWLFSPNEHLFLFSRKAISVILQEKGFRYIKFIDAYFGNDYDMFLVASKCPINENSEEQIRKCLYRNPYGRLTKALITASEKKRESELEKEKISCSRDSLEEQLNNLVDDYKNLEKNRDGLLGQLEGLMLSHQELEKNRDELRGQLEGLMLSYQELEKNRDELLGQLEGLMLSYQELEKNRDGLLLQLQKSMDGEKV